MATTTTQVSHVFHPQSTFPASIALSQHTAPVHEHRCLYTHDLRRKAKRWQDGFVKFHTFNKRVMLYDVPRNFIGGMHFQEAASEGLSDGDELTLDGSGVLIQVAERLGVAQTDISTIWTKKAAATDDSRSPPNNTVRPALQLASKQSNSWSRRSREPASTTRHSIRSPFELRREAAGNQDLNVERPQKRARRDDDEHVSLSALLSANQPPLSGHIPRNTGARLALSEVASERASRSNNTVGESYRSISRIEKQSRTNNKVVDKAGYIDNAQNGTIDGSARSDYAHKILHEADRETVPNRSANNRKREKQKSHQKARTINEHSAVQQRENERFDERMNGDTHNAAQATQGQSRFNNSGISQPKEGGEERTKTTSKANEFPLGYLANHDHYNAPRSQSVLNSNLATSENARSATSQTRQHSPPVCTTNHLTVVEAEHDLNMTSGSSQLTGGQAEKSSKRKTKSLRLASGEPRKTLLCQSTVPIQSVASNLHRDRVNIPNSPREHGSQLKQRAPSEQTSSWPYTSPPAVSKQVEDLDTTVSVPNEDQQTVVRATGDEVKATAADVEGHGHRSTTSPIHSLSKSTTPPSQQRILQRQSSKDYSHLDAQLLEAPLNDELPAEVESEPLDHTDTSAPTANDDKITTEEEGIAPHNAEPATEEIRTEQDVKPVEPTAVTNHEESAVHAEPLQSDRISSKRKQVNPKFAPPLLRRPPSNPANDQPALAMGHDTGDTAVVKTPALVHAASKVLADGSDVSAQSTSESGKGPWSNEAWDLFGWCPAAKKAALGWRYDLS